MNIQSSAVTWRRSLHELERQQVGQIEVGQRPHRPERGLDVAAREQPVDDAESDDADEDASAARTAAPA